MNITPFDIYFWQQADSIKGSFIALSIAASVVSIIFCAIAAAIASEGGDDWHEPFKRATKAILVTIGLWFLCAIVPNSKTIALMYVIPAISNSEPIQKDLPELYDMAKNALRELVKPEKQ